MATLPSVNLVAVLGAAIASMVIGAIWYSPNMFGKKWMKLTMKMQMPKGASKKAIAQMKEQMQKSMMKGYALTFVTTLITAYVLAVLARLIGATTVMGGAEIGFLAWFGFVATNSLGGYIWENDPIDMYFLKAGFTLVSLVVMGAIVAFWV